DSPDATGPRSHRAGRSLPSQTHSAWCASGAAWGHTGPCPAPCGRERRTTRPGRTRLPRASSGPPRGEQGLARVERETEAAPPVLAPPATPPLHDDTTRVPPALQRAAGCLRPADTVLAPGCRFVPLPEPQSLW